ncbi:MAG: PHP domain-containing protein, partial [Bacillota bacterium]
YLAKIEGTHVKVDLHIHSTASDGSWRPQELVAEVDKAGIGLFAVTDHDTVASIIPVQQWAAEAGLVFLPGVEVSTTAGGKSFHILGYGIDPGAAALQQLLRHNTELLERVDHDSIRKLIAGGFAIDYAEYCAYRHDPVRGGWKSLSFLIDKGFCRDVQDFFTNLFTVERGLDFPAYPPPAEVVGAIHAAGGVAVLAHPGSDFHGAALEETLERLGHEELDGVECFHPGHDEATTRRVLAWCRAKGLLITGGSDCHGSFVPQRRLGVPPVRLDQLRLGKLAERI